MWFKKEEKVYTSQWQTKRAFKRYYSPSNGGFVIDGQNHMSLKHSFENVAVFAPPGTGKTFNTINESLKIIGYRTSSNTRFRMEEFVRIYFLILNALQKVLAC